MGRLGRGGLQETYQTIYLVSQPSHQNETFTPGVILPLILFPFFTYRIWTTAKGKKRIGMLIFLAFLAAFTVFTNISWQDTNAEHAKRLIDAETNGLTSEIEGKVEDFKPMPPEGHVMESFCVKNVCFDYSDYVVTGGFNNTSSHGGPIRAGLRVRIHYIKGFVPSEGNVITRLEVMH
jgi:hypothetical protein